jgi:serine/threonine protein kinase
LESYLAPAPGPGAGGNDAARRYLLTQLVRLDLEYGWRQPSGIAGSSRQGPFLEDYARRYPEISSSEPLLLELIGEEYRARRVWSEPPRHAEYVTRFPPLGSRLQELLRRIDAELTAEYGRGRPAISNVSIPDSPIGAAIKKPPVEPIGQPVGSVANLLDALRRNSLLSEVQSRELGKEIKGANVKEIAGRLLQRGWLSPYQVNQVLQGRLKELIVGPYLLLERLGEGGAGQVFKARHQKMNRIVALKLIRKELLTDPEVVGRFYREIQVLSQLDHPNSVHAYDAGPAGATHFLAMEYVEGTDLGKLVKQGGPLPVQQACEYIRQAALGLQHAHARGLVHRDIKPHNLIMSVRDGLIKVADLGLARLPRTTNAEFTAALSGAMGSGTLTPANAVMMGTVDYLAPEQALDFHAADIRADIYSLGCTFYYLLTGQPPFSGTTLAEKLVKHQQAEPPALGQYRKDLPGGLEAVVGKMLAKQPDKRYQTPSDLSQALAEYCSPGRVASMKGQRLSADVFARIPFLQQSSLRWKVVAGGLAIILLSLALWLLLSPTSPLSRAHAKAIIDKAIKASGDQTKFKAQTWFEKGTDYGTGTPRPFTAKFAVQFPDQFRLEIGDSRITVDRNKGWLVGGNNWKEMTKEQLATQRENLHGTWVLSLLPLNDKEFTFASLGESKVNDRAVFGVKVSSQGHKDVLLYFDKATNLLVKSEQTIGLLPRSWFDPAMAETPDPKWVRQEAFYSDYKSVQGVQIPMKIVIKRDGKLYQELEKHDIQLVEKLDDKLFREP